MEWLASLAQGYSQGDREALRGKVEWKCVGPLAKHCFYCNLLVKMSVNKDTRIKRQENRLCFLVEAVVNIIKGDRFLGGEEDCVCFYDLLQSMYIFFMYVALHF